MKRLLLCLTVLALIQAVGCGSAPRIPPKDAPRAEWELVLREGSSTSRELAVRKLAELDTDFTRDFVTEAVSNDDPFARVAAADVLGAWEESDKAASVLKALLSDEVFLVRWQAINSLAETGSPQAVEPLAGVTRDEPSPVLRGEAARSLGKLGRQEAIPHLVEALRDGQASVALAAAESLAQLTGQPVVPNYQAWKSYLASDPEPLRALAQQRSDTRKENRELADKKGRGLFSTIGRGLKRLFTRGD